MKPLALLALAGLSLAGCATAPAVEEGYARGSLGVAAIERQDWAAAEAALMEMREISEDDPARLINLGKVYMETGRLGLAMTAWRRALASDRHVMVETLGGRWVSTRQLAEQALAENEPRFRTAAR